MSGILVYADFNGLFGQFLCLSRGDSCRDESGREVALRAGMRLTAFDDDVDDAGRPDRLLASGVVEPARPDLVGRHARWMLRIDEHGVRHESDVGSAR